MKGGDSPMNMFSEVWHKLAKSKKYREEFVAAQLKRGIPFQARALLKNRKWSQEILAEKSGLTQGVVSRALSPNYGNLTLNTIIRIAAGFDVAFVGKFVPFTALT
ncbi:MAG: helix-turn-helix domain-containing protein, partial [Candidatus Binatia bacterium]